MPREVLWCGGLSAVEGLYKDFIFVWHDKAMEVFEKKTVILGIAAFLIAAFFFACGYMAAQHKNIAPIIITTTD